MKLRRRGRAITSESGTGGREPGDAAPAALAASPLRSEAANAAEELLVLLVIIKVRFLSPPYSNCPGSTCLTHLGTEGSGGIIGTFHHLYFAGATPAVIGLGAIFSAFEVVPLTLIGYEAWKNIRLAQPTKKSQWIANYKWPIYFFVAVAFWNLVGAGLFGFLINPPISLYYVQGLNLTPVHGHTALFGIYGMLGLGLTLFCLRALMPGRKWNETPLKLSFWSLNFGLIFMVIFSMLPVGLLQAWASIEHGTWYARSAEFMQSGSMQTLRWMRVPGDILFAIGAALFAWFVLGLLTGHSYSKEVQGGTDVSLHDSNEERTVALAGR